MMPHPERVFRNIQMSWTDYSKSGGQDALSPGCGSGCCISGVG